MDKDTEIVFYDVETTGKVTTRDEVIQFAAIITDINFRIKSVINRFCFSNMPIHYEAQALHGLDREMLLSYSGGKYFEQIVEEHSIFRQKKNLVWVAYNDKFDKSIMNNTLLNNSAVNPINFGARLYTLDRQIPSGRYNLDAMQLLNSVLNGGKTTKLEYHLENNTGVSREAMYEMYKQFCSRIKLNFPVKESHDALFDCFVLWVLFDKHKHLVYS